jgi:hypothetical protein
MRQLNPEGGLINYHNEENYFHPVLIEAHIIFLPLGKKSRPLGKAQYAHALHHFKFVPVSHKAFDKH